MEAKKAWENRITRGYKQGLRNNCRYTNSKWSEIICV